MPQYRRARLHGGTFFFTVVTYCRRPLFADAVARRLLGNSFRECLTRQPFQLDAIVLLPEHLHAIWSLPPGISAHFVRVTRPSTPEPRRRRPRSGPVDVVDWAAITD